MRAYETELGDVDISLNIGVQGLWGGKTRLDWRWG
jgi:hypothetical protein